MKILFHTFHPDDEIFIKFLSMKSLAPVFWLKLYNNEYVTVAFEYSKKMPLAITKEEKNRYGVMLHEMFNKSGKKVGDNVDDLTFQIFEMGRPPSIYNIGGVSAHWKSQKHISIYIG